MKTLSLLCSALFLFSACHPRIYDFNAVPKSMGPNDTIRVNWKVKRAGTPTVRDYNYPGFGKGKLAAVNLLVTLRGKTTAFLLAPDSTFKIPLPAAEDSLSLCKKTDRINDDRLRYLTLVVTRKGQDSSRVIQIALRPDSAIDEIGFRPVIRGDSLIGEGINNPVRWGNNFGILSIAGGNRVMDVYHSGISETISADAMPIYSFKGTPVQGYWAFRTLLTAAEKSNPT